MSADVDHRHGSGSVDPGPAGARVPAAGEGAQALRVGLVAPPWVPVPPSTYGGTEGFVDSLARGLAAQGHEVRLFTIGESTCPVERSFLFETAPEPMGQAVLEGAHVAAAYEWLADCDVIHDNNTTGPVWAAATGFPVPVVLTCHGHLPPEQQHLYAALGRWSALTAISRHQHDSAPGVPWSRVVHHGIDVERITPGDGSGGYVVFVGRLVPEKGAKEAIEIARRAGVPLRIAAKMREPAEQEYFAEFVEPALGPDVEFLGEVSPADRDHLVGGALALLNPISWAEPFGLVMAEAMACGTPVVAYPSGAAPEIVVDGVTGYLCHDERAAATALARVGELDRRACRQHVETAFSTKRMVSDYAALYSEVMARGRGRPA